MREPRIVGTIEDPIERLKLDRKRQDPRRLAHLFWTLAKPYWKYAPGAKMHLASVIFFGLLQSAISVLFSYVSRDFWTALQKKDVQAFWRQISLFSGLLVLALPIIVWYSYVKDRLALRWRQWHTRKLLGEYFAERNYYEIDQKSNVDNVDQRIAEDTSAFTSTSLSLLMTIFMSSINLFNFSVILMTIYPRLFVVLLAYASAGTLLTILFGKRLISLNFTQLQREADFRFSIIRVRENAESIAFYHGEKREKFEIERRFGSAVDNLVDLITWSRNLALFTTTYTYIIQILPLSVIAPLYFKGTIELGVVSQSQQAFRNILDDLSLIVMQFESLSAFSAGIDRLGELEEFLYSRYQDSLTMREHMRDAARGATDGKEIPSESSGGDSAEDDNFRSDSSDYGEGDETADLDGARKARFASYGAYAASVAKDGAETELVNMEQGSKPPRIRTTVRSQHLSPQAPQAGLADNDRVVVAVNELTLMTPDKSHRVLFEDLSLKIKLGQRMLIVGPSGTGKSSFLRALAGLWTHGRGRIQRPALRSMFFLPQKPYCTLGSLREQLIYPRKVSGASETTEDLERVLETVHLGSLPNRVDGLDDIRDWANLLSLGEQQRLAFARLLLAEPTLAILDESTSALDLAYEREMYQALQAKGTTYVSVGHRTSLKEYHDILLTISAPGEPCTVEYLTRD